MPKVSIGMPVYNGEKFIKTALDSLIAQNFEDWELLIADNASSDATASICTEYVARDKRISYVRHEVNEGAMFNFKYVLKQAQSEFFMWAACDDIWEADFISECVNLLSANLKRSVAFCEILNVDTFNRPYKTEKSFQALSMNSSCSLIYRYIMEHELFGKANIIYGLYRLNAIKDVMRLPFDAGKPSCDCIINLAILARGGLVVSDKTLFRKRTARNSDSEEKIDFVVIDVKRPDRYEHVGLVDYYWPDAFIALRDTRYLKCLYWALPIRFIRIYGAVWLNFLRGWVVNQWRLIK